jgi:hypothetical protein
MYITVVIIIDVETTIKAIFMSFFFRFCFPHVGSRRIRAVYSNNFHNIRTLFMLGIFFFFVLFRTY